MMLLTDLLTTSGAGPILTVVDFPRLVLRPVKLAPWLWGSLVALALSAFTLVVGQSASQEQPRGGPQPSGKDSKSDAPCPAGTLPDRHAPNQDACIPVPLSPK